MRRCTVGIAVAASALLLAACGGNGTHKPTAAGHDRRPAPLDARKVQTAIASSILHERGVRADVTCPTGVVPHQRVRFYCVAEVGSRNTTFRVTQTPGGALHYTGLASGRAPILNAQLIGAVISRSIKLRTGRTVNVICPTGIPRQKGLAFVCVAGLRTRHSVDYVVQQTNGEGSISYTRY